MLPFELAGELLSDAEGVRSRLFDRNVGGFTVAVVPVPVPAPAPVADVVEVVDDVVATPTWLLVLQLSRESNGLTGLLLLTDFSLSPVPLESSDLTILDSPSLCREAFIRSGLRGGGSGGSDAAMVGPAARPFICIPHTTGAPPCPCACASASESDSHSDL